MRPDWKFDIPAYAMSVVVVNEKADLWDAVRPYGGVMLADGELRVKKGALEGAASWTHNYCNIAQTAKSDDKLVKAPNETFVVGWRGPQYRCAAASRSWPR